MNNAASQENAQCEEEKKNIKQRSWLLIDSNDELGMGNSVPEEKRNNNERPRKEIKSNLN